MGTQHDRGSFARQPGDLAPNRLSRDGIQSCRGLIQQQKLWRMDQGRRELQLSAQPPERRSAGRVSKNGRSAKRSITVDTALDGVVNSKGFRTKVQIFFYRKARIERVALR